MHKRTTRKIGNVRITRTESNGKVKTSQSTTLKGSNGFQTTRRISKNNKGQDVHHYSTSFGNGWTRQETRRPISVKPKSVKSKTRSTSSRKSKSNNEMSLGYGIGMGLLFVAYSALEIISKF